MMKLIEDLGVIYPKEGVVTKYRMGIYECTQCGSHTMCNTAYVKRTNKELCDTCANKTKVQPMKPLEQSDFRMLIIEDLGRIPTGAGSRIERRAIFECCGCKKHIECDPRNSAVKNQEYCLSCSNSNNNLKHGDHKTRLYKIWGGMKKRCYGNDPKCNDYKLKGITVCDEWLNNYEAFKEWSMENGYTDDLSIDRENNDLGYSPGNCRWTTKAVQARNTKVLRKGNATGYRGVSINTDKVLYRARITVNSKQILIGVFERPEEAAYAYDKFVIDNNLEHSTNGLYVKGE